MRTAAHPRQPQPPQKTGSCSSVPASISPPTTRVPNLPQSNVWRVKGVIFSRDTATSASAGTPAGQVLGEGSET